MYDLLIVGSGPAGLSAAIYAKRSNLNIAVIEKEYMGTGQIAESERVDNYPGLYGISGFDLGEKLREHAQALEVEFIENEIIKIAVVKNNGTTTFILTGSDDVEYRAQSLIYAAGAVPREGKISGEKELSGRGVSYCALCDGAFYRGKKVAVLGGGDTALDDALYLSDIADTVYLIHRRDKFRGAESTLNKLKEKENVIILKNEEVSIINGNAKVEGIELKSGKSILVDGVFVAFGSVPKSDLIRELADTDEGGYIIASEDGKTGTDGLFVAGDVRTKELRQVVTAVSDGANAATGAYKYIRG